MSWVLFPMDHSLLAYTHLLVNINSSATFFSLSQAHCGKDLALAFLRFNRADRLFIKKIIIWIVGQLVYSVNWFSFCRLSAHLRSREVVYGEPQSWQCFCQASHNCFFLAWISKLNLHLILGGSESRFPEPEPLFRGTLLRHELPVLLRCRLHDVSTAFISSLILSLNCFDVVSFVRYLSKVNLGSAINLFRVAWLSNPGTMRSLTRLSLSSPTLDVFVKELGEVE